MKTLKEQSGQLFVPGFKKILFIILLVFIFFLISAYSISLIISSHEKIIRKEFTSLKYNDYLYSNKNISSHGLKVKNCCNESSISIQYSKSNIISCNQVDISGQLNFKKEYIYLQVNNHLTDSTEPDSFGKFYFHDILLKRGRNLINIYYDDQEFVLFYLLFKDSTITAPSILSYRFSKDSNYLYLIGLGNISTNYFLKVGQFSIPILTDQCGTFYSKIAIDSSSGCKGTTDTGNNYTRRSIIESLPGNSFFRKTNVLIGPDFKSHSIKLFIQLPVESILFKNIDQGLIDKQEFIEEAFGEYGSDYEIKETRILSDSSFARIYFYLDKKRNEWYENKLTIRGTYFSYLSNFPLFSYRDSIIINIPDSLFYLFNYNTNSTGKNFKVFTGFKDLLNKDFFCIWSDEPIYTSKSNDIETSIGKIQSTKNPDPIPRNFIDYIRQLPDKVFNNKYLEILSSLLGALFLSIPLLWLFWIIMKYKFSFGDYFPKNYSVIVILLFFFYAITVSYQATDIISIIDKSLSNFSVNFSLLNCPEYKINYGILLILLFPLTISALIPESKLPSFSLWNKRVSHFILWTGGALLVIYFSILLAYYPSKLINLFIGENFFIKLLLIFMIVNLILLIMAFLLKTIFKLVLNLSLNVLKMIGSIVLLISYDPIISTLNNFYPNSFIINILIAIIIGIIGTIFLLSILRLVLYILPENYNVLTKKSWNFLIIIFFLLALPKGFIFKIDPGSYYYYSNWLFTLIRNLFVYLGLPIVFVQLYTNSRSDISQDNRFLKDLCIFLLTIYVVGFGYYWFYIPITLIIAYYFSKKILVLNPSSVSVQKSKFNTILASRKESIESVIKYLSVKKQFKSNLKSLDKKLSQNEMDFNQWEKSVTENRDTLKKLKENSEYYDVNLRNVIFSYKMDSDPWNAAIRTLKIALILAIPFIYLLIRDFRLSNTNIDYPILSITKPLLEGLSLWLILAFSFGYFYDIIKGRTGIEKALWLSLMIICARIGPAIIFADKLDQMVQLIILGIEVLIYCLLLGFFAFDFHLLRKNGYGWREIEVIYNIAFISTFGSTLAIAFAGILSGQLQQLFTKLLQSTLGN
jgi:hypothetical protein